MTQVSAIKIITRRILLLGLLGLFTPSLLAAQSNIHQAIEQFLEAQTQNLPGTVNYSIGQIDTRTQQTACTNYSAFLPPGGRLWGKSTLGIRCLAPNTWTAYVQIQVRIVGDYLVAARSLRAGNILSASDLNVINGELSAQPPSVLTDPAQAIGKSVKNGLAAGQALRSEALAAPWAVQQGQTVRTVANGPGFSVSSEGKAQNNAAEGQLVQVRTPNGQVVSGIARNGGIVEMQ